MNDELAFDYVNSSVCFNDILDTICMIPQGVRDTDAVQRLSYLVFPVVIWSSFRFNRIGVPLAVLVVAIIASAGTADHKGPLYRQNNNHSLLQVIRFCNILLRENETYILHLMQIQHDLARYANVLNLMQQVQMFVCVLAVVAITLAAIVHDRKAMESRLNEMNSTLELQVLCLHIINKFDIVNLTMFLLLAAKA